MKSRTKSVLITIAIIISAILLYVFLMKEQGIYFPCVTYSCFGIYCPGCGASRMLLAVCRGDYAEAFSQNAFIPICVIMWIVIFMLRKFSVKFCKISVYVWLAITIFLAMLFAILRNLPEFSFLAPKTMIY